MPLTRESGHLRVLKGCLKEGIQKVASKPET